MRTPPPPRRISMGPPRHLQQRCSSSSAAAASRVPPPSSTPCAPSIRPHAPATVRPCARRHARAPAAIRPCARRHTRSPVVVRPCAAWRCRRGGWTPGRWPRARRQGSPSASSRAGPRPAAEAAAEPSSATLPTRRPVPAAWRAQRGRGVRRGQRRGGPSGLA
uniref:Uncharacterized protein n=1 Tax=Arundo donax TaxID=35708 RepID=A0A0A9HL71_ARUDO